MQHNINKWSQAEFSHEYNLKTFKAIEKVTKVNKPTTRSSWVDWQEESLSMKYETFISVQFPCVPRALRKIDVTVSQTRMLEFAHKSNDDAVVKLALLHEPAVPLT